MSELKNKINEVNRELQELRNSYNKLIDEIINSDKMKIELFGYPPDFEKKTKGKPVNLELLHKLLIELRI
jgi:hypothetical protein